MQKPPDEDGRVPLDKSRSLKRSADADSSSHCDEQQPVTSKRQNVIVDPDTQKEIADPKRPKLQLDKSKKVKCLSALCSMHENVIILLLDMMHKSKDPGTKEARDSKYTELCRDVILSSHITSIILTVHYTNMHETRAQTTNMQSQVLATDYKIHYRGVDYVIARSPINTKWIEILREEDLEYKLYNMEDPDNWYRKMDLYLNMFAAFKLRLNELRLGHSAMAIKKINGRVYTAFKVSKYGLTRAHHILLQGSSFPPERRSSTLHCLGPMTAFLCMITSEGIYRNKYAAAVKRAMAHIPAIDDIIEVTKSIETSSELSTLVMLIAETLLRTPSRRATVMCFPLNFLSELVKGDQGSTNRILEFFNITGSGGWYLYKKCTEIDWIMQGNMSQEMASQMCYHSIFGTYNEDLSILEQITNTGNWYTRKDIGTSFKEMTSGNIVKLVLPKQRYYSKISCTNQTGLLSDVQGNQVSCVPCFSGFRTQVFSEDYFNHIEKRRAESGRKSVQEIITGLIVTIEELHNMPKKDAEKLKMESAVWRDISTLQINKPGDQVAITFIGHEKV